MATYDLAEPLRRETTDIGTGRLVRVRFKKGRHIPKNEAEEVALEEAVRTGIAKRVTKSRQSRRPARPSPEPASPDASEDRSA